MMWYYYTVLVCTRQVDYLSGANLTGISGGGGKVLNYAYDADNNEYDVNMKPLLILLFMVVICKFLSHHLLTQVEYF